jgi:hypothetical protein
VQPNSGGVAGVVEDSAAKTPDGGQRNCGRDGPPSLLIIISPLTPQVLGCRLTVVPAPCKINTADRAPPNPV